MDQAIEIKGFTKKYGDFTAVNQLNLEIKKGEIIGFVGKNGAGKSTTLRCILDLIHPTEGTITILGMDSRKESKEIKKRVSYIPSESSFYDNITGKQLLKFAMQFTQITMQQLEALADKFELDLSKKVMELSLGNRKKVSIVQGLIKDAEVIILDEPTNGLDPLMQNILFELLLEEKAKGKTIFLSSHNLSEIEKYCDKVAIIKGGKLLDYMDMKAVKIQQKQVVTYRTVEGEEVSHVVEDLNALVGKLAQLNLAQLEIKNQTVEDEFIAYYKGEK